MLTLLLLGILALFAVFSAVTAERQHRNPVGWALVGFFLGPVGLLVAILPALPDPAQQAALQAQTRTCPECREPIRYDARVCKHCGLRYPYLAEPVRTHVAAVSDLHREGRSAAEIVSTLEGRGVHPAHGNGWTTEMIASILHDHVT